jgi:glycosyltransferase involved in cell wall biosynthesis
MKSISFCIASAKNEKYYTLGVLDSLKRNTQFDNHEVLIFIDSDNQNTYEALLEYRKDKPNIKIYRNTSQFPVGSQRNVSIMFSQATKDIVIYLQSDMVVCPDLTNIFRGYW